MSSDELVGVKSTIVLDNRQSMLYSGEGNEYLIKKSCQVVSPQIFKYQTINIPNTFNYSSNHITTCS